MAGGKGSFFPPAVCHLCRALPCQTTGNNPNTNAMIRVNFVCLGNICRSPMAEAVFRRMVEEAGLEDQIAVDSAGTGAWHVGEPAHRGTRDILRQRGIIYQGRARQVSQNDMHQDSYIIAMDASNVRDLQRRFGAHPNLYRLLDFAPGRHEEDVPDPYYSGNFDEVYELVEEGCRGLLEMIREEKGL
ncbi:MAG: low molecular weight protein-tyrosine-phosphatase [Candidatus Promineifilaceae bacterium]|nr:low molecular weight protein-tyrosine-phosphatase [Candidatus Promineifilaceae bacterium]